jgi:uncharacterized protein involved in exopolysaccharide biosynthesis
MDNNVRPSGDSDPTSPSDYSLIGVLRTLWQWRKPIVYTAAAAAIGAILISLLLADYFKAETRFLALSPDQYTPEAIFGLTNSKTYFYGNMNDIDRVMAIAESNELADYLIETHGLYEHYDIDPDHDRAVSKVRGHFFDLYEVSKTPRDEVKIEMEDKEPELAAALANAARDRVDYLNKEIYREYLRKTIEVMQGEVSGKQQYLDGFADSLRKIREVYDIYDLNTQMELLSTKSNEAIQGILGAKAKITAYENGRIRGAQDSIAKISVELAAMERVKLSLDTQLVQLNSGMEPMLNMLDGRGRMSLALNEDLKRLKMFESALTSNQSSIAVLEVAQAPVVKSRPKRMFIVIGAVFVAFVLAVLGVLAIDNSRKFDWSKITE